MGEVNLNNQQDLKELMYGTDEYGKKLAKECAEFVLSDREEQNSQKCMASSRSFYGGNHTPNVVYSEWPGASNYVDGNDNQEVPQDDCSIVQQQIISDWSSKNADSSNFNSEECDSDDSPFLEVLEESSSLVEQKLPLTEDEKKIINKSLEEIEEVTKKNDQEYKRACLTQT
ncbi:MAG: hypothetical protein ACR5K9_04400 [Wolbachia sp.]